MRQGQPNGSYYTPIATQMTHFARSVIKKLSQSLATIGTAFICSSVLIAPLT